MTDQELFDKVIEKAEYFGYRRNENAIQRKYLFSSDKKKGDDGDGAYYFGFINVGEPEQGAYKDLSLVVFTGNKESLSECVVALCVGSQGFGEDRDVVSLPGLRRKFLKLRNEENKDIIFFKSNFDDIQSTFLSLTKNIEKASPVQKAISTFRNVIVAAEIIDFSDPEKAVEAINKWLAIYADFRQWGIKKDADARNSVIKDIINLHHKDFDERDHIKELLDKHKYVVLQGAPGVGKTFVALSVAEGFEKVYFTQFHAETSYSDFVGGIKPNINTSNGGFVNSKGVLLEAIDYAKAPEHANEKVLLIIDEINRANLSNVLGPVFYLFEKNTGGRHARVLKIGDSEIDRLPSNLYVIATMNTADRSLAVVDFALRRRFIWYTIRPKAIKPKSKGDKFFAKQFNAIADIFEMHASDEELNLQPGPAYFIAKDEEEMRERLIYELMPLIKEYLNEGYLSSARDEFCNFFLDKTGQHLFY